MRALGVLGTMSAVMLAVGAMVVPAAAADELTAEAYPAAIFRGQRGNGPRSYHSIWSNVLHRSKLRGDNGSTVDISDSHADLSGKRQSGHAQLRDEFLPSRCRSERV